jgi:hypothetical protein
MFAAMLAGSSAPERESALLARCVERLGGRKAGLADVRALVLGDREALLLHLRAAAFGDSVACEVDCPSCAQQLDLDVPVGDLLVDAYPEAATEHRLTLDRGEALRFRLPTGADLEAAARAPDAAAGAAMVLQRCVLGSAVLDDEARTALADELGRLDPQADLRIVADCPSCGEGFDTTLDPGALVLDELVGTANREVKPPG